MQGKETYLSFGCPTPCFPSRWVLKCFFITKAQLWNTHRDREQEREPESSAEQLQVNATDIIQQQQINTGWHRLGRTFVAVFICKTHICLFFTLKGVSSFTDETWRYMTCVSSFVRLFYPFEMLHDNLNRPFCCILRQLPGSSSAIISCQRWVFWQKFVEKLHKRNIFCTINYLNGNQSLEVNDCVFKHLVVRGETQPSTCCWSVWRTNVCRCSRIQTRMYLQPVKNTDIPATAMLWFSRGLGVYCVS